MYTTPLMVSSVEPSIASVRRNKDWSAGLLQHPIAIMSTNLEITRRQFLKSAGALVVAFGLPVELRAQTVARDGSGARRRLSGLHAIPPPTQESRRAI